jgi:hypothetical protein
MVDHLILKTLSLQIKTTTVNSHHILDQTHSSNNKTKKEAEDAAD